MPASGAAAEGAGPDHPPRAGGRSGGKGTCRLCVALLIVIPLIECCLIIVPLATMFSITSDPLIIPAVSLSGGDTRIVSFPWPSSLCGGITLVDNSRRPKSWLFLVAHPPPLTKWNNFTFSSSLTLADNAYHYWNYYLRPNSNFTTEVCMYPNSAGAGTFYLIKGRNNFQKWVNVPSSSDEALAFFSITSFPCSARSKQRYSFQVQAEDEYYFVFYGKRSHSITDSISLLLNVTISIDQLQYSVGLPLFFGTAPRCQTSGLPKGSCTLPALTYANGSNYKALIYTNTPINRKNGNWALTFDLSLHCAYRAWTFAVAVLVPFILVNVIFCCTFGMVVGVILLLEKKERSNSTPVPTVQQRAPRIELRHIRSFPKAQDHNPVTLTGKQDLTVVAPPTYGDSLGYPSIANDVPSKLCEEFPPSYECATNKV